MNIDRLESKVEIQSDVVLFKLKFIARGLPYDFKVMIKDIDGKGLDDSCLFVLERKPSCVILYMSKFYCQGALARV